MENYRRFNELTGAAYDPEGIMITSRGCPGRCTYCGGHTVHGFRPRMRSARNVLQEVAHIVETYRVVNLNFWDDMFTADKHRVLDICNGIMACESSISWLAFARANSIDREILEVMKQSGCRELNFGVESGSPEILRIMRKGISLDRVRKAIDLCKEIGIKTSAGFMLGLEDDTIATMKQTVDFALELHDRGLDTSAFWITVPFPGTEMYERVHDQIKSFDWRDYTIYGNGLYNSEPVYVPKGLTTKDLTDMQRSANERRRAIKSP